MIQVVFEDGVRLERKGAGEAAKAWRVGRVLALVRPMERENLEIGSGEG